MSDMDVKLIRPRDLAVGDLVERWYGNAMNQRVAHCVVVDVVKGKGAGGSMCYVVRIEVPIELRNLIAPSFRLYPTGRVSVVSQ